MKIGFAKREITPPAGMELGGYAGYRPNSGVHDPLWCKVILLEQAGVRYGLVVLDLMCADESLCTRIAAAVAPLGVSKERLIVSAIHSHAAPAGVGDAEDYAHRGFEAFLELIDTWKPKFFVHGHMHMNYSMDLSRIEEYAGTKVVNCCERYVLELDDPNRISWSRWETFLARFLLIPQFLYLHKFL